MLARIDLRGSALPGTRELAGLLPRAATDIDSVLATVRPLCEDVRIRGAQAVREITARLDGVDNEDFAVPPEALDRALAECDPTLRAALEEAIARVQKVHADQRRTDGTWVTRRASAVGVVCVNWQQVCLGQAAAGHPVDVWVTEEVLQFYDGDQLLRTEKRTTPGEVRVKR